MRFHGGVRDVAVQVCFLDNGRGQFFTCCNVAGRRCNRGLRGVFKQMFENSFVVDAGIGKVKIGFDSGEGLFGGLVVGVKHSDEIAFSNDLHAIHCRSCGGVDRKQAGPMRRWSQDFSVEHSGQADIPCKLSLSGDFIEGVALQIRGSADGVIGCRLEGRQRVEVFFNGLSGRQLPVGQSARGTVAVVYKTVFRNQPV